MWAVAPIGLIFQIMLGGGASWAAEPGCMVPTRVVCDDLIPAGKLTVCSFEFRSSFVEHGVGLLAAESDCPCVKVLRFPGYVEAGGTVRVTVATHILNPGPVTQRLELETDAHEPLVVFVDLKVKREEQADELPQCWGLPAALLQVREVPADPCQFVSPTEIGPSTIIVDARSWLAGTAVTIPGAVKLRPHALSSSIALRGTDRPVVLIEEGWANPVLTKLCRQLQRDRDLTIHMLAGGFSSWARNGGKWQGSPDALKRFTEIPPAAYYAVRGNGSWIVTDFSRTPSADVTLLFPRALRGDPDRPGLSLAQLSSSCADTGMDRAARFLVINEDGDYTQIKRAHQRGPKDGPMLLYLQGGWRAFADYLQGQALKVENRRVVAGASPGCLDCP